MFLEGSIAGLALLLTVVAVASWKRARSKRAGVLALAFAAFLAKGVLLLTGVIEQGSVPSAIDLGVLALLYGSLLTG